MQFVCDRCKAKYDIDEARLRGKSVKIRCRSCGNILEVRDPNLPPGSKPSLPPVAPPRGRERVAMPIGAPSRGPVAPPPRAPAPGAVLGERFQQAFAGREAVPAVVPAPAAPAPQVSLPDSGDATHIIAAPFLGEAAKAIAAQEVARKLARWHVSIRNQPMGPMSEEAIRRHIENGEVGVNSLVWREGFDEWRPLGQVRDLAYLAELAVKAAGGGGPGSSRESIFELPPLQRVVVSQAPPVSPLQRWLVHAIVAVVFFALGMIVMYLVSDGGGGSSDGPGPASSGLPAVEEVATAGEALPTLHSGALTIQLTNPTVVAEEVVHPQAAAGGGTTTSSGGGTRRTTGSSGGSSTTSGGASTGTGTTGFLPGRDTDPIGGEIRTGGGAAAAGTGTPAARPLSAQQILPVVQSGQSGIQHCYNQARARDFIADLSLRLTIEISPDGSVRKATLTSQDYLSGDLETCIVGRVRQWSFPRATATSRVVLPFSFHQN
ncbi:MAG: zinc-ribbon domain-containing protein [Deltaproteobacteria bacterium]|nr:zinc-ribbon domain-containing protein [Deltaproteobacteria bacterium]